MSAEGTEEVDRLGRALSEANKDILHLEDEKAYLSQ